MENTKTTINKKRLAITIIILLLFIGLIVGLYFGLGIHNELMNTDYLKEKIQAYGNKGKFIYILINLLQTTIIPITNIPTIMAGTYIFGPFIAATLATIGVLVGSVVSFFIGRFLGRKTVEWIAGKENVDRYLVMAKGRENLVIFLILLLPGFPDDIICIIAGLTKMSFKFFIISILITRTIPTYLTAYSAEVIPINKLWGIIVWLLIYLIIFFAGRYVLKNWDKIRERFEKNKSNEYND